MKLSHFDYEHLPVNLQGASKPFHDLANEIDGTVSVDTQQKEVALQKLLEAKDAWVRAQVR